MNVMVVRAAMLSLLFVTPAFAQKPPAKSPNGLWRCSAQGNIPIGLMTMSGNSYRFQVVSNTAWALKPTDGGNGSGQMTVAGSKLTPVSGPLKTKYGTATGFYGTTSSPYSGTYEYIDLLKEPQAAYLLRCHRPE
jgi:hypothetical protein